MKAGIEFEGFAVLDDMIERFGGDVKAAAEEALIETQRVQAEACKIAAAPYKRGNGGAKGYATGEMYDSICEDKRVEWSGTKATIETGFDYRRPGGKHSLFVQNGTPRRESVRGKPNPMQADEKIWQSVKGMKIREDIAKVQSEIFKKHADMAYNAKYGGK